MDEETRYQPVEPTTPVPYPYGIIQIAPPPPPESFPQKKRRIIWWRIFVLFTMIALIGGGTLYFTFPSLQGKQSVPPPTVTATLLVTTPTATITPSPTPAVTVNPNYTATDIMQDFRAAGRYPKFVEYNRTIWSWTQDTYFVSVDATSSVDFTDDGGCTDHCSPGDVGVWVYNSHDIAFQAYNDVLNDKSQDGSIPMMGTPNEVLHGRCLLLTTLFGSGSIYEQVVTQDCV